MTPLACQMGGKATRIVLHDTSKKSRPARRWRARPRTDISTFMQPPPGAMREGETLGRAVGRSTHAIFVDPPHYRVCGGHALISYWCYQSGRPQRCVHIHNSLSGSEYRTRGENTYG